MSSSVMLGFIVSLRARFAGLGFSTTVNADVNGWIFGLPLMRRFGVRLILMWCFGCKCSR